MRYWGLHRSHVPRSGAQRYPAESARAQLAWSKAARALPAQRRARWSFLQRQWLLSPETTGWLGGVHAPVRTLRKAYTGLLNRRTYCNICMPSYVRKAPLSFYHKQFLPWPRCYSLVCRFPWDAELYVMLAAKFTTRRPLAEGLHYVTLLRDPISRFLSEFYETYDGWEVSKLL